MTNLGVLERSGFDGVYSYLRNLGKIINHAVLPREENMFYLCSQIIKESPAAEYLKVQNKHSINAFNIPISPRKPMKFYWSRDVRRPPKKTRSYCICKTSHSEWILDDIEYITAGEPHYANIIYNVFSRASVAWLSDICHPERPSKTPSHPHIGAYGRFYCSPRHIMPSLVTPQVVLR